MTETRTSTSRSAICELDAAVLRQALLGDVQLGHDLQARDDRRLEVLDLRRDRGFHQHAVNAVADAQLVLERLDVDVGRRRSIASVSTWLTNLMMPSSAFSVAATSVVSIIVLSFRGSPSGYRSSPRPGHRNA